MTDAIKNLNRRINSNACNREALEEVTHLVCETAEYDEQLPDRIIELVLSEEAILLDDSEQYGDLAVDDIDSPLYIASDMIMDDDLDDDDVDNLNDTGSYDPSREADLGSELDSLEEDVADTNTVFDDIGLTENFII